MGFKSDDPTDKELGRQTKVISRIPLEDMRELWYWGMWKEYTPSDFSTSVLVVCTSREACRIYLKGQMHDYWLLDSDESPPGQQPTVLTRRQATFPPPPADDEIFDDSGSDDQDCRRRFKLLSYQTLVEAMQQEIKSYWEYGLTLLVNPRAGNEHRIEADAMFDVKYFLRDLCSLNNGEPLQEADAAARRSDAARRAWVTRRARAAAAAAAESLASAVKFDDQDVKPEPGTGEPGEGTWSDEGHGQDSCKESNRP